MIFVPKGHIGQGVQEVRLQCVIDGLLLDVVGRAFRIRNELIGQRIRVAPTIYAERGNSLTVKRLSKNIRRFEADPSQTVHLKSPFLDIPVKGAPVMAVNGHVDADMLEVILNDRGQS